eukprot:745810-Hanusia_phi.AAC.1
MRARADTIYMQGLRRRVHMRARAAAIYMQGMRGRGRVRARAGTIDARRAGGGGFVTQLIDLFGDSSNHGVLGASEGRR